MAITFKSANDNGNFTNSNAVAAGGTNAAGDMNLVWVSWDNLNKLNSVTDNKTNKYVPIASVFGTSRALALYACFNAVSGAAPTVTAAFSGNSDTAVAVDVYSGLAPHWPLLVWTSASGTSATPTVGPITPAPAASLVVGGINGNANPSAGGTWNLRDNGYSSGAIHGGVIDMILASSSAQSPNWTMTSGAFIAIAVAFGTVDQEYALLRAPETSIILVQVPAQLIVSVAAAPVLPASAYPVVGPATPMLDLEPRARQLQGGALPTPGAFLAMAATILPLTERGSLVVSQPAPPPASALPLTFRETRPPPEDSNAGMRGTMLPPSAQALLPIETRVITATPGALLTGPSSAPVTVASAVALRSLETRVPDSLPGAILRGDALPRSAAPISAPATSPPDTIPGVRLVGGALPAQGVALAPPATSPPATLPGALLPGGTLPARVPLLSPPATEAPPTRPGAVLAGGALPSTAAPLQAPATTPPATLPGVVATGGALPASGTALSQPPTTVPPTTPAQLVSGSPPTFPASARPLVPTETRQPQTDPGAILSGAALPRAGAPLQAPLIAAPPTIPGDFLFGGALPASVPLFLVVATEAPPTRPGAVTAAPQAAPPAPPIAGAQTTTPPLLPGAFLVGRALPTPASPLLAPATQPPPTLPGAFVFGAAPIVPAIVLQMSDGLPMPPPVRPTFISGFGSPPAPPAPPITGIPVAASTQFRYVAVGQALVPVAVGQVFAPVVFKK